MLVLKNLVKNFLKRFSPLEPKEVQEIVEQEPASPSIPDTPSVVEDLAYLSTSLDSETHEEKRPSSRVKLNHHLKLLWET